MKVRQSYFKITMNDQKNNLIEKEIAVLTIRAMQELSDLIVLWTKMRYKNINWTFLKHETAEV